MRLSLADLAVLDLTRDAWGQRRLDDVTARLDQVADLRRREGPVDRRVERALARGRLPHVPGPIGADVAWAVATALLAVGASRVSVPVALLFGAASAVAVALAVELLVARRRRVRADTAAP